MKKKKVKIWTPAVYREVPPIYVQSIFFFLNWVGVVYIQVRSIVPEMTVVLVSRFYSTRFPFLLRLWFTSDLTLYIYIVSEALTSAHVNQYVYVQGQNSWSCGATAFVYLCGIVPLARTSLCWWRTPKQKGVLADTAVPVTGPGSRSGGWRTTPGGLGVGGCRSRYRSECASAVRSWSWEQESAVVGVLVWVGVCWPLLARLYGRFGVRAGGKLGQLVFQMPYLLC